MGGIPVQGTHEESLSGMSNAWNWAKTHTKPIISIAVGTFAFICLFFALLHGTELKRVTIVADGQVIEAVTDQATVAEVLAEHGVQLHEHDLISIPVDAALRDGATVTIERAFPVQIQADGKTTEVYTTASDVESVLENAGIELGPLDKIEPSLTSMIEEETDIRVVRVKRVVEETEHPLPYETLKKNDNTLSKGKQKVLQEGQEGKLIKQIEKIYEDGVLVSEQVLSRTVEQEALHEVVAVGTKTEPAVVKSAVSVLSAETHEVTLNGMTFGVKGVMKNVTLTAYTAHYASTGKNEDDPGFGVTASGTKVTEGRTIAVDPDVIPMGWWVYIDGIGFRRAEDKGSAVKGNKIDVYFDSEEVAKKFGTKKGFTVYVIGPKKPVVN